MKRLFVLIIFHFCSQITNAQTNYHTSKKVLLLMGTRFEITAISDNEELATASIEAAIKEVQRIEKLISSWDEHSQTSKINRNAGIKAIKVDKELYDLIGRSLKVSKLTSGAFDISYASMDKVWKFDGSMTKPPTMIAIKSSVEKIDYKNVILNPKGTSVFLKEKGMRIGFGAIGKGYAANRIKKIMMDMGIKSGLANAGGDLVTWGKMENGDDWRVGIAKPNKSNMVFSWLTISNMAVVTSGNYEKSFIYDGKRYAHIIDPRTGYPTVGIKSVTIICPDPELADALATSVFVLGENEGIALINQLKGIECLIINDNDELITSEELNLNYYQGTEDYRDGYNLKIGKQ